MIHQPRRRQLSRHQRDARIGYGALAVSAVAFVMVLAASFVVIKVAPDVELGVPAALAPAQAVTKHPAIRPAPARTPATRDIVRPEADIRTPAPDAAAPPQVAPGQGPVPVPVRDPEPVPSGSDGPGPGPAPDPDGPPRPGPPRPGPVSGLVDPVVGALTGTPDQVVGEVTQPLTGPVGDLTDGVTDVVDGLLGHP